MSQSEPTEKSPVLENDWLLQSLVNSVNKSSIKFNITLQMSGMLVSGTLISGEEYFNKFAENLAGLSPGSDSASSLKQTLSTFGSEGYSPSGDAIGEESSLAFTKLSFIHLEKARFFSTASGPIIQHEGVLWRGRIREVQGFFLGSIILGSINNPA
ncbi:MAG: gas vesicle accessory protein GvpU [Candidatus Competibacterales bacterium]